MLTIRRKYILFLCFVTALLYFGHEFLFSSSGISSATCFLTSDSSSNNLNTVSLKHKYNKTLNITEFRLLTAFSSNHFCEALRSCKTVGSLNETQTWMPGFMIAYILSDDVTVEQLIQYRTQCPFVTIRRFNATVYPNFVKNLNEFRWKPIIVDEVLKEVEKVFYFDSSVVFLENLNESITDIVQEMNTKFNKCGVRHFGTAGHSIAFATHPKMLQYFNVSEDSAKKNQMTAATFFVISREGYGILKKWKTCALEKECMAPEGSELYCNSFLRNFYGYCHRFDQSALSILAFKCSSKLSDFYEPSPLLDVQRM